MAIELDHLLVPSHDRVNAARQLAELLGVPWAESGVGPFCPVYVNAGLTLDFDQAQGASSDSVLPVQHYCFRVDDATFDAILGRIQTAGIPYRSLPHGPMDRQVNRHGGGRGVYWDQPDGHVWELLTVSYARQPSP